MKKEWESIKKVLKELYNRYLYLLVKPIIIMLVIVLLIKLISFVSENVIDFTAVVLDLTLPFILGFFISLLLEPVINFMNKKLRFPRVLAVIITISLTLLIIFGSIGALIYAACVQIIDMINDSLVYIEGIEWVTLISSIEAFVSSSIIADYITAEQFNTYIAEIKNNLSTIIVTVTGWLSTFGKWLATWSSEVVINWIPNIIVVTFVAFFTSFFLSKDKDKMIALSVRLLPSKVVDSFITLRNESVRNIVNYARGQIILVSISGLIFFITFLVMGSPYALALALLCAFLDLMPIIGTILLIAPWAIICLIQGDMYSFWALVIGYVIAFVLRQILEPKIMGDSLGFHPLALMASLYIGAKLFGALGFIVGPMSLVLGKILLDAGLIKFKKLNEEEPLETEINNDNQEQDRTIK